MRGFWESIRKDWLEYVRSHKSVICIALLFCSCAMVLTATIILPSLLNKVMQSNDFFNNDTSLAEFMGKFFPDNLRSSMGILASDIGAFYGMVAVFFTYSLVPDDIRSGRVILPLCAGHSKKVMVLSKEIVYSFLMSIPVFAMYMSYYFVAGNFLLNDYNVITALVNGIVLTFCVFSIINITIPLSIIFVSKYETLAVMAGLILIVPDTLSFFKAGQYFPSYLLTFTYISSDDYKSLLVPVAIMVAIIVVLNTWVIGFRLKLDIDDRR